MLVSNLIPFVLPFNDMQLCNIIIFKKNSSLYFYHDCISKTVIQYCKDASPTVVNLVIPENRRREMVTNCGSYTRDQCNKASNLNLNYNLIYFFIIVAMSYQYF